MKRIAARKACMIAEAVYRYNTTPKDAVTAASTPTNALTRICLISREHEGRMSLETPSG